MEIKLTCPLGNTCEEIKDNQQYRCRAYTEIAGKYPQSEEMIKEWRCSIFEWLPILLIEIAQTNRGQTQALESFRNKMVEGQTIFNLLSARRNEILKEVGINEVKEIT